MSEVSAQLPAEPQGKECVKPQPAEAAVQQKHPLNENIPHKNGIQPTEKQERGASVEEGASSNGVDDNDGCVGGGFTQEEEMKSWACDACTFENDLGAKNCEICGTGRDSGGGMQSPDNIQEGMMWSCIECTYLNQLGTQSCEMCGHSARRSNDSTVGSKRKIEDSNDGMPLANGKRTNELSHLDENVDIMDDTLFPPPANEDVGGTTKQETKIKCQLCNQVFKDMDGARDHASETHSGRYDMKPLVQIYDSYSPCEVSSSSTNGSTHFPSAMSSSNRPPRQGGTVRFEDEEIKDAQGDSDGDDAWVKIICKCGYKNDDYAVYCRKCEKPLKKDRNADDLVSGSHSWVNSMGTRMTQAQDEQGKFLKKVKRALNEVCNAVKEGATREEVVQTVGNFLLQNSESQLQTLNLAITQIEEELGMPALQYYKNVQDLSGSINRIGKRQKTDRMNFQSPVQSDVEDDIPHNDGESLWKGPNQKDPQDDVSVQEVKSDYEYDAKIEEETFKELDPMILEYIDSLPSDAIWTCRFCRQRVPDGYKTCIRCNQNKKTRLSPLKITVTPPEDDENEHDNVDLQNDPNTWKCSHCSTINVDKVNECSHCRAIRAGVVCVMCYETGVCYEFLPCKCMEPLCTDCVTQGEEEHCKVCGNLGVWKFFEPEIREADSNDVENSNGEKGSTVISFSKPKIKILDKDDDEKSDGGGQYSPTDTSSSHASTPPMHIEPLISFPDGSSNESMSSDDFKSDFNFNNHFHDQSSHTFNDNETTKINGSNDGDTNNFADSEPSCKIQITIVPKNAEDTLQSNLRNLKTDMSTAFDEGDYKNASRLQSEINEIKTKLEELKFGTNKIDITKEAV